MPLELYQEAWLCRDIPDENLTAGDVAVIVDFVRHPQGGEDGAVLEIFNVLGESIAVVTVPTSAIATLHAEQVPAVRSLR
jgi:hypothetical protein